MLENTRAQLGVTQAQMAALMGMTQSSYNRLEKGHRLPTKQHICQAKALLLLHKHNLISQLI
jgi:transcriptional regulator with XRE-family HTH domain